MRWQAALALGVLIAAAAGRADDEPPAKKPPSVHDELQRLQGTWQVESWEEGGKPVAAAELKKRAVFFGADAIVFKQDNKVLKAGLVKLDPGKTPRTFTAMTKTPAREEAVLLGVYEFGPDTVTLCFDPAGQTRPTAVKADAKAGFTVAVLRKPKPPADEQIEIVGKYTSEVIDPEGRSQTTEAVIERRGDAYMVVYSKEGRLMFVGTAMRKGDQLSMCWVSNGQTGVSVYKIEKGPKLTGEFTTLAGPGVIGKEVLTPFRRID
jgi:uncharacterized protein (TIGR03067 family)